MATAFKTVMDALVAALLTPPTIVGTRVHSARARPLPAEHTNDIVVTLERMQARPIVLSGAPMDWDVLYGIEVRARAESGSDAGTALDTLLGLVYARLTTVAPPAGVLGWWLSPQIRVDVEEAATPIGHLQLALDVQLRTPHDSLALAS